MPNRNLVPLAILPKQANGCVIDPSMFACKDNLTMASWHPKRSEHVLLLPSLHRNVYITRGGSSFLNLGGGEGRERGVGGWGHNSTVFLSGLGNCSKKFSFL